jgi:hypothetical protein
VSGLSVRGWGGQPIDVIMSQSAARITSVRFERFKAFRDFRLDLKSFNVLVGPNNAGKSTIIAAFKILGSALKRAHSRKPENLTIRKTPRQGYVIDISEISISEENIFFNYNAEEDATVSFALSNGNSISLYFTEGGACYLLPDAQGAILRQVKDFKRLFPIQIGFVPILGPVEHREELNAPETARRAMYNARASRNFRNIWHHDGSDFDEFQNLLQETWPGMDIKRPTVNPGTPKATLSMMCPEARRDREIAWSGYGFQVWCQILTHIVKSKGNSLFLIDEPDIYLHADLQRSLINTLRGLECDVIIATHSSEIIAESELGELVIVDKSKRRSNRVQTSPQIKEAFRWVGTNLNVTLTQIAKTGRVIFVEGQDMSLLSRIAKQACLPKIASRRDFGVIPMNGFRPEVAKERLEGMRAIHGGEIKSAIILDRDYRSDHETTNIREACSEFADVVHLHGCKEIENFLLVPAAIDRALAKLCNNRLEKGQMLADVSGFARSHLDQYAIDNEDEIAARYIASYQEFQRRVGNKAANASLNTAALKEFKRKWANNESRDRLLPGKKAVSTIAQAVNDKYGETLTTFSIVESMDKSSIHIDAIDLFEKLSHFIDH